ncbi:MAG: hypothetical protein WBK20_07690 [Spirochaetota bacterium]
MTEEELKHYFIQYWYCTNPSILMIDDLKNVLFNIFCEVEKTVPIKVGEHRLEIIFKLYKQRILKGKVS